MPTQSSSAKPSGDAAPSSPPKAASTSSSSSCWKILAVIPLVLVALIGGIEFATTTNTTGDSDNNNSPGLDFGKGTMFDKIANEYDLINRVLAMNMDIGWRRSMTQRIGEILSNQEDSHNSNSNSDSNTNTNTNTNTWKILDMATGTADVALQLVEDLAKFQKTTTVLGLDPSENMLAVGRAKIRDRKLTSQIVLETADARDLKEYYARTLDDSEKFDAATMAFGIRNVVPHRTKALCEIHKLLKPNGVLAIMEFSNPSYESDGILGAAAGVFIRHVVPFVGGLLSGGAKQEYRHLQNSIKEFPTPDDFKHQLQTLECPLRDDDDDVYFYVGHYAMEEVVHMNFGSVQLYIGRAVVKQKSNLKKADPKLPPIGA